VTDRRDTALPAASQPGSRADRIMWATVDIVRRPWMFWLPLAGGPAESADELAVAGSEQAAP
jgi:hypothetical protein